jgi:hypothetical protein
MPLLAILGLPALVIGTLDAYQALTGNRVSKRPSRRSDAEMRRQSAIAAAVLLPVGLLSVVAGMVI